MKRARITITIKQSILDRLDSLIDNREIRNRSNAIENLVENQLKEREISLAVIRGPLKKIKVNKREYLDLLIPVNGSSLVELNIEKLKTIGVREFVFSVGDYKDELKEYLGDGSRYGVVFRYIENKGTSRILSKVKEMVKGTFVMVNGDIFLDNIDFWDMLNFHKNNKAFGTIAVANTMDPSSLGSIHMKGSYINDFREKEKDEERLSHLVNGGIYFLEPELCDMKISKSGMIENDIFPRLAKEKHLIGYQIGEKWIHLHDTTHISKAVIGGYITN